MVLRGFEMRSMGMLTAMMCVFGAPSYSEIMRVKQGWDCSFSGKYPKKQNKLSQKGKRKRARQKGV